MKRGTVMVKKILIIEDDSNIAELIRLYVERDGFEVTIAPDGGKGISAFETVGPDLGDFIEQLDVIHISLL